MTERDDFEDGEFIEEVEHVFHLMNPRKDHALVENDEDLEWSYQKLFNDLNSINEKRNKIITLHLHIEKAMDRIIKLAGYEKKKWFLQNLEMLKNNGLLESKTFENIKIINTLRNDYAHTLDTDAIEEKYAELLSKVTFSWETDGNVHQDKFQLIVHQTLFELIEIYNKERVKKGEGTILKGLTDEQVRQELEREGKLFWQSCKVLHFEKRGYFEIYTLECPYCNKGEIIRHYDRTPGFKESEFRRCNVCGLGGDGSTLKLDTVLKKK